MEYADQMAYPQPGVEAYAQMAAPDPSVYAQAAAMAALADTRESVRQNQSGDTAQPMWMPMKP